ncbi:MtrB/PioB family decaheme-associated outer membrane protein [Dechloromonas sp. HYN0024]|uniref:MtrB/PioB family decaheme-associated outer membrane protein n=1 Tax=Dechloromonas sp. HYN0024 TaxID=2231055 RepID=UPI0013C2D4F7|nr:MtrB/PioB family decaheme-associated outer membrane protein [Dechloromonas sp. HYN0024]
MSKQTNFMRTAIFVALSAAFPFAEVQADDEIDALVNPNATEATFKLPYMDKVNPLYRQYNGVNQTGISGNIDLNIVNRNNQGQWFKLQAENLGLSTQEIGISYEQQGDWALGLDYNQIPRYAPYQVNTAVAGIGSNQITQPSYANGAFSGGTLTNPVVYETNLKTQRDIATLSASKFLMEGLKLSFSFKNEEKTGTRMDGVRGVAGTGTPNRYSGYLFSPEPINQSHQQFEATLDYSAAKFQLSAGYYGSFLSAKNNSLAIVGGTNTALVSTGAGGLSPIALSPDNQVQQIYVNGAYNFTDSTRGSLKVAYSEGRQNENFLFRTDVNPGIGSNLDAKVQTTEAFASLTSRITKDFKLLGSWRYEDKSDKTPVRLFYTGYPNNPESHVANWGKAEADYRIGGGFSINGGFDYTHKRSLEWERREVEELTTRLSLRKSMGETVNGTITLAHADRTGSDWEGGNPTIYPVYLADRQREKVRGMVDWSPAERLNLQFAYEAFFDKYTKSAYGLDSGEGQVFSFDANYDISDNWKLNGWYSKQTGNIQQNMQGAVCSGTGTCASGTTTFRTGGLIQWDAKLNQDSDQFGFGITGKLSVFDVGAKYFYTRDLTKQEISPLPATTCLNAACTSTGVVATGMGIIPDAKYTQNTFSLYGTYQVSKATKLRLDYIYDLRKMDDYTWQNWVYADGTRIYVKPEQTTQIFGISLIQSF